MSKRTLILTGVYFFAACAHHPAAQTQIRAPELLAEMTPDEPPQAQAGFASIYFGYDESTLPAAAADTLAQAGDYLKAHPTVTVTVAGHADERGTEEYNLALADQRAWSAKDYLVRYGVEASRVHTISYGKERPADAGHDEAAWAKNRRDELSLAPPAQQARR